MRRPAGHGPAQHIGDLRVGRFGWKAGIATLVQFSADGYSNAAMAEKLEASDSTVRTHLRSINTKFAARSRAEAVAIGRRLGVIR